MTIKAGVIKKIGAPRQSERSDYTIAADEARDIVYGEHEDWEEKQNTIVDLERWCVLYQWIGLHKPSKNYYMVYFRKGATESQDEGPFEYDEHAEFVEVRPVEKTITVYVPLDKT